MFEATFGELVEEIHASEATFREILESAIDSDVTFGEILEGIVDFEITESTDQSMDQGSVTQPIGNVPIGNIQAVGDSILGFNQEQMLSIPDVVGRELGVSAVNNAVGGAEFGGPEGIPTLYQSGAFSHVLVNGGGNDLSRDCSQATVDRIISADLSSGQMVDLVNRISTDGAQTVIMGYFLPRDGQIGCPLVRDLLNRYQQLGQTRQDVTYVSTLNTITPNTPSFYFGPNDPVHPSPAGSEAIGQLIANQLRTDSLITGNTPVIEPSSSANNNPQGDGQLASSPNNDDLLGDDGYSQLWGGEEDDLLQGGLSNLIEEDFLGSHVSDIFTLVEQEDINTADEFETGIDFLNLANELTLGAFTEDARDTLSNLIDNFFTEVPGISTLNESSLTIV